MSTSDSSVDTLQQEALRLLQRQIDLIEKMLRVKHLIVPQKNSEEMQSFSPRSARDDIEVLREEIQKLESLVLVVAVVGTMKAGKSTAINAIVGTEVLPTRNRPMTAVPTLIKHKSNAHNPVLRFEKNSPVNDLLVRLRARLEHQIDDVAGEMDRDRHYADLVSSIGEGKQFKTRYEGAGEIAAFLWDLNDLVRISRKLDEEFPFDSYDSMDDFPTIEIDFEHVDGPGGHGTLCLLDTPGPNESQQPHLHGVLREQLKKASAVVVVLDYTQILSDADRVLREEIRKVASTLDNRTFAMVNKFDQRGEKDDSESKLRDRVHQDLLPGSISKDHIYPVSAMQAYLSHRAKNELRRRGKLPDVTDESWVEDFGRQAFGTGWMRLIGKPEEIGDAANELWKSSKFDPFIRDVIWRAHNDVAVMAVEAASAKLSHYGEQMSNFLSIRRSTAEKDSEVLEKKIQPLRTQADRIERERKDALNQADLLMREIAGKMERVCQEVKGRLSKEIDDFFELRMTLSEEEEGKKAAEKGRHRGFLDWLKEVMGDSPKVHSTGSTVSTIEIRSRSDFDKLLSNLEDSFKRIKTAFENDLREASVKAVRDHIPKIEKLLLGKARLIAAELNDSLSVDFGIRVTLPNEEWGISALALEGIDAAISEVEYEEERKRRKGGLWGWFCERFGTTDWGWESYSVQQTKRVINIEKLKSTMERNASSFLDTASRYVDEHIGNPLRGDIQVYCEELESKVRRLLGDLKQAIQDQELEREQRRRLGRNVKKLLDAVKTIVTDCDGLETDLHALRREQRIEVQNDAE